MIDAIAIYDISADKFVKCSQKRSVSFFNSAQLDILKKAITCFSVDTASSEEIYCIQTNGEQHYIQLITVNKKNIALAMISRKKLDNTEAAHLLKNIEHIYTKPHLIKDTLDTIISNPLGYTGKDILTGSVLQQIRKIENIMVSNINKLNERGIILGELVDKSNGIIDISATFNQQAKKLSPCRC